MILVKLNWGFISFMILWQNTPDERGIRYGIVKSEVE